MTTARRTRRVASKAAEPCELAAKRLVAGIARADAASDPTLAAILELADELASLAADLWVANKLDDFDAAEEDDAEDR